jgi:hypothetical protein
VKTDINKVVDPTKLFLNFIFNRADLYAFGGKFSNNNDEAGNAFGSFQAGGEAAHLMFREMFDTLYYIGHECMHSEENCPTREQMRAQAKKAIEFVLTEMRSNPRTEYIDLYEHK